MDSMKPLQLNIPLHIKYIRSLSDVSPLAYYLLARYL